MGSRGSTCRRSPGRPTRLSPRQKAERAALVEAGPDPERDGVVRWRRIDLKRRIETMFGVGMHERTAGKQLAALGLRRLQVAPAAPEGGCGSAGGVQRNVSEAGATALPEAAKAKPLEIWFQDKARVGQQGTPTRVWARRGTRPRAMRNTRYQWAYLFGAVCPRRGVAAGLVLRFTPTLKR